MLIRDNNNLTCLEAANTRSSNAGDLRSRLTSGRPWAMFERMIRLPASSERATQVTGNYTRKGDIKMKKLFLAIGLAACLAACGSAPEPAPEQPATTSALGDDCVIPTWYQTVPQDSIFILVRGNGTHARLDRAERAAMRAATRTLIDGMRSAIEQQTNERITEVDDSQGIDIDLDFVKEEMNGISNMEVIGLYPSEKYQYVCTAKDGQFHVFMLGQLPKEQIFEQLKTEIRKTKLMKRLFEERADLETLSSAVTDAVAAGSIP